MGGVWAFLGEGFLLRQYKYATECADHDLSSLRSFLNE
jgi:hypothetical protein